MLKAADVGDYICSLFESKTLVTISAVGVMAVNFLFPTTEYRLAAIAVFGVMVLDIITKIFSLSRVNGGLLKAFKTHEINSSSLAKGTLDKLIVFGVMIVICGLAYKLAVASEIAIWFTQIVFTLMFLRDVLSILENLSDAGIDVGLFKHIVKKKLTEYCDEEEVNKLIKKREVEKGVEDEDETNAQGEQNK